MSEFKNLPSGWRVVRLGDVAEKSILKNRNSSIKLVLSNSAIDGLVAQNEYFDKDIANKENIQDYYIVDLGDFVYNPRISQSAPTGPINRNMLSKGIVSPLYTVFTVQDEILAKFLEYFFKTIVWQNQVKSVANYGARHDRINITDNAFFSLKILTPPLDEQKKIAKILSTWDEAINLTINLIENKKQFKKALMQNLLTAKIRFLQFKEKWKEIKLGEICEIQTGKLNANAMIQGGRYKFFTCAKEVFEIDDYAFDTEAILVSGNGENVGYIHYFNGKFNAYQRTYVLDKFTENILFIKYFLEFALKRKIEIEKKDGNTPYIVLSTIFGFIVKLPNLKEQQKIAEVLTACDDEINLLNLKLENLKKQKQGLMQKLLSGKVIIE